MSFKQGLQIVIYKDLAKIKMRFLIIIFDIFNYTARIADSYGIGRNMFHDNTACSDDRVFTDGHTRKDCRAASYPYTIFYKTGRAIVSQMDAPGHVLSGILSAR